MHLQNETSVSRFLWPGRLLWKGSEGGGYDLRLAMNMQQGFEISFLSFIDVMLLSLVCTIRFFFLITCVYNEKNHLYLAIVCQHTQISEEVHLPVAPVYGNT